MPELPQLVTCDWLQFWCRKHAFDPEELSRKTHFKVENLRRGTRVFSEVFQVVEKSTYTRSRRDEVFAVMTMTPYSPIIDRDMVIVKIDNRALYHSDLYKRIVLMLKAFDFDYQAITRFDICCDFVRFANGLHPLELLEGYRSNRYVKAGSRSYCQWGNAPYTVTTIPYKITDEVRRTSHVYHSVSWGGAKSDAHVKMYNKSREIRIESHKRYIQEYWRRNGLISDEDIWRVEVSVGGRSRALVDTNTSELVQISLLEACSGRWLNATFLALAARHFGFIDVSHAKTRKDAAQLGLWSLSSDIQYVSITMPSRPDITRTVKVCTNFLAQLPSKVELTSFCRATMGAPMAIYNCLVVLNEIYQDLRVVKDNMQYRAHEYAEKMMNDYDLLKHFGVVRAKDSAERLEDLATLLENNDKRRALEEALYKAYLIAISPISDNKENGPAGAQCGPAEVSM